MRKFILLSVLLLSGSTLWALDHCPIEKKVVKITSNPQDYPYKNHVYYMMGVSVVDRANLTPLGDYTVGFCFISDVDGRSFSLDRTITLDKVWLNGKKYERDQTKQHYYTNDPYEVIRWWVFAGPTKATPKEGGWNLESLEGDELDDYLTFSNKGRKWVHDPKVIASCFDFKVRTIDECRKMWVKEFTGEWKWNVEKGVYEEVPIGQRVPEKREEFDPRKLPIIPFQPNPEIEAEMRREKIKKLP